MTTGAEIPFRRSRRPQDATGSLIFDRERDTRVQRESQADGMRIWMNGHFRKR